MNNKMLNMVAFWLVVVGGLNWGLVGLLHMNLVESVLGNWPFLVTVVYVLVGLSAVWLAVMNMQGSKKR